MTDDKDIPTVKGMEWMKDVFKKERKPAQTKMRNVVDGFTDGRTGISYDVLECGHVIRVRKDLWGTAEVNSERRRCRKCVLEQEN